jgi:hypothetical protein
MKSAKTAYRFLVDIDIRTKFVAFAVACDCFCNATNAATVLVPQNLSNSEGGSGAFFDAPQRMQMLYENSTFDFEGASTVEISALAFRVNNPGFAFSGFWDLDVRMSTTAATETTMSPLFSANVGADETLGLARTRMNISSDYTSSGPNSFSVVIPLPNRFRYTPSLGNLLVDVRSYDLLVTPGGVPRYDAQEAPDGLAIVFGELSSLSGAYGSVGFVTQFTFTPIPEPDTVILVLCGCVILRLVKRKYVPSS